MFVVPTASAAFCCFLKILIPCPSWADVTACDAASVRGTRRAASCVLFHPDPESRTVLVAAPDNHVKLFKLGPPQAVASGRSVHSKVSIRVTKTLDRGGACHGGKVVQANCADNNLAKYVGAMKKKNNFAKNEQQFGNVPDCGIFLRIFCPSQICLGGFFFFCANVPISLQSNAILYCRASTSKAFAQCC